MIKTFFPESKLAHKYLDGLKGIEIGAAAHNSFGLDTLNVSLESNIYKENQIKLCGTYAKIDIVANGNNIPVPDKSFDFVISSHVIEHFYNPVEALKEWNRIARKYIFIIAPHKDRMFDKDRSVTTLKEFIDRKDVNNAKYRDFHHCVFTTESFKELVEYCGFDIIEYNNVDDKVGNGFMFLLKAF